MKMTIFVLVLSLYSLFANASERQQVKNCDIKHMDDSVTKEQLSAKGYNIVPFEAKGNNFFFGGGGVEILTDSTNANVGIWLTMAGLTVYKNGAKKVADEQIPACKEMYKLAESVQLEKDESLSCAIEKGDDMLVNIECHIRHLSYFSKETSRLADLTKKVSENICTHFLFSSSNNSEFSQFDIVSQQGQRAKFLFFDFLRIDGGTTDPHGLASTRASFKCRQ